MNRLSRFATTAITATALTAAATGIASAQGGYTWCPGQPLPMHGLGWDMNVYAASLIYTLSSGYRDSNAGIPAPFNNNYVSDYGIVDLGFIYRGVKGLTLRAGVLNVLDKDPPFTNQTARFQARAYDDRFHNPIGRTWTLGASYQF